MIPLNAVLPAAAAGALVGLAVKAAWPARPDLNAVLDRLDAEKAPDLQLASSDAAGSDNLAEKVGGRLLDELGDRLALPMEDLALLRKSPAEFLGRRVLFSLGGLLFPQLFQAMMALAGAPFPYVIPLFLSLGLAALMWIWPRVELRREAAATRLVVRHAVASYLERVALARIANSGAAQALTKTAEVGDGFIFARMRRVFAQADLSGVTVWDALKQLGDELDIPELTRPADTLALAGEGAAVYTTLQAQARQLRVALLADAKSQANAASAAMVLPVTFAVILMLAFVMIPLTATILGS
ncbi:type II secretion system F family protein [Streptomyces xanthochromogenes]|uniref:type II secretion system F family protein n=1 Tax=Streptomyces xanthochromogenes TaxID=67384 RepID=UPI003820F591